LGISSLLVERAKKTMKTSIELTGRRTFQMQTKKFRKLLGNNKEKREADAHVFNFVSLFVDLSFRNEFEEAMCCSGM
jgi:hypothetical protein